jgi:hypothetical protein
MATDYTAIAKRKIYVPSDTDLIDGTRMPRILIYGRNKKGKTRFSTTAPNVLILDPEDGTKQEVKRAPNVWPVGSWDDIHEAAGFMRSRHAKSPITGKPYEWCSWDGCTRIYDVAMGFVKKRAMERDLTRQPDHTEQRDFGNANSMMKEAAHQFHSIKHVGLIFTVQERMREIKNVEDLDDEDAAPATYMYLPDLPNGARSALNAMVDVIGRMYVVRGDFTRRVRQGGEIVEVPSTKDYRMWIGPHDMYDTGYRSEFDLPDYLRNPTVKSVMAAIRQGKVA